MSDGPFADNAELLASLTRIGVAMVELAQAMRAGPPPDRAGSQTGLFRPRIDQATAWIGAQWAGFETRAQASITAGRFIPWLHMVQLFRLSRAEQTLVLLALLPQTDPRCASILSGFGGPAAEGVIPLAAALAVLGGTSARPLLMECLESGGALRVWCLLEPTADAEPSTERGGYRLSAPVRAFLLGTGVPRPGWDGPLPDIGAAGAQEEERLDQMLLDPATAARAQAILRQFQAADDTIGTYLLHVQALDEPVAEHLCAALFRAIGLGSVRLDGRMLRGGCPTDRVAPLCRDLLLSNRVLVLTDPPGGLSVDGAGDMLSPLLGLLFTSQRYVAVINGPAGRLSDTAHGFVGHRVVPLRLTLPRPDGALRGRIWERCLAQQGMVAPASLATRLASAYQLTATQIARAVKEASARRILGDGTEDTLVAAARAQAEQEELAVAREVRTAWRLTDIVLPEETGAALRDVLLHARHRDAVMEEWGFATKVPEGRNLSILFHGPSGTGKTMAASALANELGLGLYRIDLAGVLSKYIGETEQRLAQLFDQAEAMNIVLFFDEAESLFARRTEAHNANDRHANLQTGYLLQRIETYPGIVILSTNLLGSLDPAFIRRFQFIIEYSFPGPAQRLELWRAAFPDKVPMADTLDHALLAERAVLTGGHIREAAIAAAMHAAAEGSGVRMEHVLKGIRREYQKLGKVFTDRDFHRAEEE